MELFEKEVKIRTHYCSFNGEDPKKVEDPHLLLYVKFKGCNANCSFCEYQNDSPPFNEDKYYSILAELKDKIRVKKVAFSGGEPTLDLERLSRIIKRTRVDLPGAYIVLNTNGIRLKELFEDQSLVSIIDNISISRHHYDDKINNSIFRTETISSKDIKKLGKNIRRKKIFHLSCNLIKGFIDSKEEVYNFLEYTNSLKIKSVGFISLMPINEYSRKSYVDFNKLDLINENFRNVKSLKYEDICKCNNYIYIPKNYKRIIKVYHKYTYKPDCIDINLNFDGECLRNGFNGNIIY